MKQEDDTWDTCVPLARDAFRPTFYPSSISPESDKESSSVARPDRQITDYRQQHTTLASERPGTAKKHSLASGILWFLARTHLVAKAKASYRTWLQEPCSEGREVPHQDIPIKANREGSMDSSSSSRARGTGSNRAATLDSSRADRGSMDRAIPHREGSMDRGSMGRARIASSRRAIPQGGSMDSLRASIISNNRANTVSLRASTISNRANTVNLRASSKATVCPNHSAELPHAALQRSSTCMMPNY